MLKSQNDLQEFAATQTLYCVWIRANETLGAPLVSVWVDSKMRAFEEPGETAWTVAVEIEPSGEARKPPESLTSCDVKHSV